MTNQILESIIPTNFPDDSRVWIFQSNRAFIEKERIEINEQLEQFFQQWNYHGKPVRSWANLLFNQFIVVIADETDVRLGGCGLDASTRLIKSLERQYSVNLFDRLSITFLKNDKAEMLPLEQIQYAIDNGFINSKTLVFNNVVYTKKELLNLWLVPLEQSWLTDRINLN